MKNLKIKTKRDWCIAAVFTTFIVYAISTRFSQTFQSILLKYGNPMMTNMNQPKSYGNVMFTIAAMVIIVEAMLFIHKKPKWVMGLLGVVGIFSVVAVFQLYLYNVDKIVSVTEEADGGYVSIGYWANDDWRVDEEKAKEIFDLCEKLEPLPESEQAEIEKELAENDDFTADSILIWAQYPEKYGHNFDLMVCIYEDKIFVNKGYDNKGRDIVTFFDDNGLLEMVDSCR